MYKIENCESLSQLTSLIEINNLQYVVLDNDNLPDIYIIYEKEPIAIIEFADSFSYIQWFEVFPQFQRSGNGIEIIKYILCTLEKETKDFFVRATPLDQDVEQFWRKCGFKMTTHPPVMIYTSYDDL